MPASALSAAIAVVFWNTIVLPAWLLRQTTVPLAKVALGLGLIFIGLIVFALESFPFEILSVPLLNTASTLLCVLGPILCLEIARKRGPMGYSSGRSRYRSRHWCSGPTLR